MDEHGYHYSDVQAILEALQAEGLPLSISQVYERRGRKGSNGYISADIKRWKHEQGLTEQLSGEDQEDIPTIPALDVPYTLPGPDPSMVERHVEHYRLQVDLPVLHSHLKACIAALRCVQATLPKVLPGLERRHMRTQAGVGFLDCSRAPWRDASETLEERLPELLQATETFVQAMTLATTPEEDGHDGHGRPAA